MQKVCSFYSQNNEIAWLSNMADILGGNSWGAQRYVGFVFLIVLSRCWMAGCANSDHVVTPVGWALMYHPFSSPDMLPWPLVSHMATDETVRGNHFKNKTVYRWEWASHFRHRARKTDWDPLVQWASESSVFLVPLLTLLVHWVSWKELKEQACFMACPVGKRVFCFPCPTLNSTCPLGKLERTERTSTF